MFPIAGAFVGGVVGGVVGTLCPPGAGSIVLGAGGAAIGATFGQMIGGGFGGGFAVEAVYYCSESGSVRWRSDWDWDTGGRSSLYFSHHDQPRLILSP